jgi:hypothetical protein
MLEPKPTGLTPFPWSAHVRVMASRSAAARKRLRAGRLEVEAARLRTEADAFDAAATELAVERDALR